MNMATGQDRRNGDGATSKDATDQAPKIKPASTLSMTHDLPKHWAKYYRTSIASGISIMLSQTVSYPLDSVKTRMQAFGRHRTVIECIKDGYRTEGIKGFYRGSLGPFFSFTLGRTLSFSVYQKAKYKYSALIGQASGGDEPLVVVNRPGSIPTFATIACFGAAGATAGSVISFYSAPFEITKIAAQTSEMMATRKNSSMSDALKDPIRSSYQQKGTFKTAINILKLHGFLGLYTGFRIHIVRDTIGSAIYFSTYESTKQMLVKLQGSNSPTSPLSVAMAGGVCGFAAVTCTYPVDSVKTEYQRKCLESNTTVKYPKVEWFNRKSYRGFGLAMARSCITNIVFFSCFEFIKKKINKLEDPVPLVSAG